MAVLPLPFPFLPQKGEEASKSSLLLDAPLAATSVPYNALFDRRVSCFYCDFIRSSNVNKHSGLIHLLRCKACSIDLRGCVHAAGESCEKRTRPYVPVALASPVGAVHSTILLLPQHKQNSSTVCTLVTWLLSVLNDPSFTTHDLLRLLWQSSPYSVILT